MQQVAPSTPERVQASLSISRYEGGAADWDAFVLGDQRSTFCHLFGWSQIIWQVLGQQPIYLVATDGDGRWQGVLPLVDVRSALFGRYLVSMPYLNYGGPLGTPDACWRLQNAAEEEAQRLGVDLLELRARWPTASPLCVTSRKITVLLDLPRSSQDLWSHGLPPKVRTDIRRARREGLEARFGVEAVSAFYSVFARNMRDLGSPALPREFFVEAADLLREHVRIGVAYRGDTPVAGGFGFVWRNEFEMTWASSLREYRTLHPNEGLYWSFMEQLISEGIGVFNFGRCSPGSGTHWFKLKWGGRDEPLPWLQYSAAGLRAPPTPDRPRYRLATSLWRHLPLAVTNRIGPRLVRGIP